MADHIWGVFFFKLWYIFIVESLILQQDRKDLIRINKSLSPEQRLEAFFHHSQLLSQLSLANKANKKQNKRNSAA